MHTRLLAVLYAALALGSIVALYDTGARYDDFRIAQAGVHSLPASELTFYGWYALWGTCAALLTTLAVLRVDWSERLLTALEGWLANPGRLVAVAALLVPLCAAAFRSWVLLDQPVADDESAYTFEALTLAAGRIVNALPEYPAYYNNQFIMLGERGWFGQYPIGHPLLLALGELLHVRWLIVPLLAAGSTWLTFRVGSHWIGPRRAALAACLLALSPQFVWTHATLFSQTSSTLCMLLGAWALLRLRDGGALRWAALAGLAFGYMLLIRPMPGVLLLTAAGLCHAGAWLVSAKSWRALIAHFAFALPGVALGGGLIAYVNFIESGSPFVSAYKTIHGGYGELSFVDGNVTNALGGALLRQNFWLLGWTVSFVFVPFCRPRRGAALFWSLIAADYAYRLLVPKTVVGTTGPIYVFEAVPLLILATVDGAATLANRLGMLGLPRARAGVFASGLASSLVALLAFFPIMSQTAYAGCSARARVYTLLEQAGAERALIFANHLVMPDRLITWAYFPPNPAPTLDDRYLFVRQPGGPGGPLSAHEFWKRKFPDRRAFLYADSPNGQLFTELQADTPPPPAASLLDLVARRMP